MFLATFGITVSLFTTAAYLIFYSQNELLKGFLKGLDFMGKITMVFLFTFAFVGSELASSGLYWLFLFLLTVALIVNLVLV